MGFPSLENLRRKQIFTRSASKRPGTRREWGRDASKGDNLGLSLA